MVKSRPHYSKDFKLRVCQELETGATVAELSRKHQIHPQLVYSWSSKYRQNPTTAFATGSGTKVPPSAAEGFEARIAELERLVGRLTVENEFLKKTLRTVEDTFGRVPPNDGTQ